MRPLDGGAVQSGGVQKCGRFTVSPQMPVETEADEERGSAAGTSPRSAPAVERAASSAGEQTNQIEALQRLHVLLEAQHHAWTKTWQDMEEQVYNALLHPDNSRTLTSQVARAHTPTSAHSSSSCRTPPCDNGSERRGGDKRSSSSVASNGPITASISQHDNPRENTLRMWSHLGSTLREVVCRNEQLDTDNRRLKMQLEQLQEQITDASRALVQATSSGEGTALGGIAATPQ